MKTLTLATLTCCCILFGCVALPPAETVATTCDRAHKEVSVDARGNSRRYRETVDAKCVDDAKHRTVASDTVRLGRNEVAKAVTYDARDGENRTQVRSNTHVSGIGVSSTTEVVKENKYFRWGARIKVRGL